MTSKATRFTRSDKGNDRTEWARALGMLEGIQTVHIATVGEDGPHVRPVTTVEHGGALHVLTGARDAKIAQLEHDPRFELAWEWKRGKRTGYIRLRGRATLLRPRAQRAAVAKAAGFVDQYWTGVDDPLLAILRLDVTAAEVLPPGSCEYVLLTRPARRRRAGGAAKRRR